MKKGSGKLIIPILLFSIMLFPLISSAPPQVNYNIQLGYEIFYPKFDYLKENQDFTFHFHVHNVSDGLLLTNSTISCNFHLYNSSGNHLIQKENIKNMDSNNIDFSYKVLAGNFTKGQYTYLIGCNSSAWGGAISIPFIVTSTGEELKSPESILYFLVTLFAFFIFGLLTYIFISMDGSNPQGENEDYLSINYKKYIKTALFPLVYVSFLWFFNFIIGLSNNYLRLALYSNTLGFIFMILTKAVYPIILLTFIWIIVLMVKDSNIEKEYKSLWSQC